MSLSDIEVRVLGSLVEKEQTTPEGYPLSINALVGACNQKTNRDPVTEFHQREVEGALQSLRDKGLVRSSMASNERVVKHLHRLEEALSVGRKEMAVLAVLMLRGAQTPGELRTRTERYTHFADLPALQGSLDRLAEHSPPLVRNLGRGPGQSQDRWMHTLGVDPERQRPRARPAQGSDGASGDGEDDGRDAREATSTARVVGPSTLELAAEVTELREELARVRRQVERLTRELGLEELEE